MTARALQRTFGRNVKSLRSAAELSLEKLAELVQLEVDALREIEAGTLPARLDTVAALAEALDVEVSELVITRIENASENRSIQDMETITVKEAAAVLKIGTDQVWRYCVSGRLNARRASSGWLIEKSSVDNFEKRSPGRPKKSSATT